MKIHRTQRNPLLVLAAAAALSACAPKIPDTLTIAVAQPLSGPQAGRGQDLLNGAKLAIDEINKAGYKIAGKAVTLELMSVDDKADPAEAKKVAQDLVDRQVFAVLGHLSSDITEATIPIYKQGNVVQLFTSSAAELTKQGEGKRSACRQRRHAGQGGGELRGRRLCAPARWRSFMRTRRTAIRCAPT